MPTSPPFDPLPPPAGSAAPREYATKVSRPQGHILRTAVPLAAQADRPARPDAVFYEGTVDTPDGIVRVYSERAFSTYELVHAGRLHRRAESQGRTPRGLVREAVRFAAATAHDGHDGHDGHAAQAADGDSARAVVTRPGALVAQAV